MGASCYSGDPAKAAARERHGAARTELAKGNDPMALRKAEKIAIKSRAAEEEECTANCFKAVAL